MAIVDVSSWPKDVGPTPLTMTFTNRLRAGEYGNFAFRAEFEHKDIEVLARFVKRVASHTGHRFVSAKLQEWRMLMTGEVASWILDLTVTSDVAVNLQDADAIRKLLGCEVVSA